MKNLWLLLGMAVASMYSFAAPAQDMPAHQRMDDQVIFDLSAEDWVTTKTAHVIVNVEATVSSTTAATMRGDMVKAVNDVAKGDWRLASFNRNQDQSGMERWSISFEARLPENELGGLNETAKKLSKPGMQLSIGEVNFTPTLVETEAVKSTLRTQIYKDANEQLAALNTAMPGRAYRIAMINFSGDETSVQAPMAFKGRAMAMMAAAPAPEAAAPPMERAEKINLNARVVLAAMPPPPSGAPQMSPPPQAPRN